MILKYAGGKSLFEAAVVPTNEEKSSSSSSKSEKDNKPEGLIPEGLLSQVLQKGLPSDVNLLQNKLYKFYSKLDQGIVDRRELSTIYKLINLIISNLNEYDKAETLVRTSDALGEVAVSETGYMFVEGKDGLKKVHMSEFNPKTQRALTTTELLNLRRNSIPFREDITSILTNSVGSSTIHDFLTKVFNTIGTAESDLELYADLASIVNGAERPTPQEYNALIKVAREWNKFGADAIFKLKETGESKNVELALKYLFNVLPKNLITQLLGRYVATGHSYKDAVLHIQDVITTSVLMNNKIKQDLSISYEKNINEAANGKRDDDDTARRLYLTTNELLFSGDLNNKNIFLSDHGVKDKYGLRFIGNTTPKLTGDNNLPVENNPLGIALDKSIMAYLNDDKIFAGDLKLNSKFELNNFTYVGDEVAHVWVPVDSQGNIDLEGLHKASEAEEEIAKNNVVDPEQKNLIHALHGSIVLYDSNGKIKPNSNVAEYIMTFGYTVAGNINSDNSMASNVPKKEAEQVYEAMKNIYDNKDVTDAGLDADVPGTPWYKAAVFWTSWDIVKLPIFIKVAPDAAINAGIYAGHGPMVKPNTLLQDIVNQGISKSPKRLIITESSIFYRNE